MTAQLETIFLNGFQYFYIHSKYVNNFCLLYSMPYKRISNRKAGAAVTYDTLCIFIFTL